MANKEPILIRVARLVLKHGYLYVDNATGRMVHDKKVERAMVAMGIDPSFEEIEDHRENEPILIKRKKGGPKINPILLDATTANLLVTIYDALSPANQARTAELVPRFKVTGYVDRMWKLYGKAKVA